MNKKSNLEDQVAILVAHVAALSLATAVTMVVANEEIPNFKERGLATLRKMVILQPARFADEEAQMIAGMATKLFRDLADV